MGITICESPKNVEVCVLSGKIMLPTRHAEAAVRHCRALIRAGLDFEDGSVYHRVTEQWDEGSLVCEVYETSYTHYLFSKKYDHDANLVPAVHVIHTATFLITSDGYVIVGEMASSTSNVGGIQAIGGTLDMQDLRSDGKLDLSGNVTREMREETGICAFDHHLRLVRRKYVVHGGKEGKIAIVYLAHLKMSLSQFEAHFAQFQETLETQGMQSEFTKVYPIKLDRIDVDQFIEDEGHRMTHYVALVLQELVR